MIRRGLQSVFVRSLSEIRLKSKSSMHNWPLPLYFRFPCSCNTGKWRIFFSRSMVLPKVFKIGREIKNGASGLWWRIAARIIPGLVPKQTGITATCVVMTSPPTPRKRKDCFSILIESPVGNCCAMTWSALVPIAVRWHPVSTTVTAVAASHSVLESLDDVKENKDLVNGKMLSCFDSRGMCNESTLWHLPITCFNAVRNTGEKLFNSIPVLLTLLRSSAIHIGTEHACQLGDIVGRSKPSTLAHQLCCWPSDPLAFALEGAPPFWPDDEPRGHSRCQWPSSLQFLQRVTLLRCWMSRLVVLPELPEKSLSPVFTLRKPRALRNSAFFCWTCR